MDIATGVAFRRTVWPADRRAGVPSTRHPSYTARSPLTGRGARLGYEPALDGLRAVAVTAVVLFHGGVPWASGGFVGVDVFFVLSGFLITSLLMTERRDTGRVSLRRFWAARARRLLPALFVVVAVVVCLAGLTTDATSRPALPGDATAALAYVANWRFALAGNGYFAESATPSPLQHTWSLSIEEQFYLLWPFALLALLRSVRSPRRAAAVTAVAAADSAAEMAWLFHPLSGPGRVYFGTDTRAQALLVGATLALLVGGRIRYPAGPGVRRVVSGCGATGIAALAGFVVTATGTSSLTYRGGLTAAAVAAALVVASIVTHPDGVIARVLRVRALAAVGRVSYGIYLWHWPVFLALTGARTGLAGLPLLTLRVVVTASLAALSWRFVETPARSYVLRVRRPRPVAAAALVGVAALVAGYRPTARAAPGPARVAAGRASSTPAGVAAPVVPVGAAAAGTDAPLRLDVFGDSVAETLGQVLAPYASPYRVSLTDRGVLGCGLTDARPLRYFGAVMNPPPECTGIIDRWVGQARTDRAGLSVVLVGRWEVMDRVWHGRWRHLGDPAFDRYLQGQLSDLVQRLSTHTPVVLLTAPYYRRGERPDGGLWPEDKPARVDRWNAIVRAVAAAGSGRVSIVDLWHRMDPHGYYQPVVDGVQLRYDGVHLTAQAGRWLSPWLFPQLRADAGSPADRGATEQRAGAAR